MITLSQFIKTAKCTDLTDIIRKLASGGYKTVKEFCESSDVRTRYGFGTAIATNTTLYICPNKQDEYSWDVLLKYGTKEEIFKACITPSEQSIVYTFYYNYLIMNDMLKEARNFIKFLLKKHPKIYIDLTNISYIYNMKEKDKDKLFNALLISTMPRSENIDNHYQVLHNILYDADYAAEFYNYIMSAPSEIIKIYSSIMYYVEKSTMMKDKFEKICNNTAALTNQITSPRSIETSFGIFNQFIKASKQDAYYYWGRRQDFETYYNSYYKYHEDELVDILKNIIYSRYGIGRKEKGLKEVLKTLKECFEAVGSKVTIMDIIDGLPEKVRQNALAMMIDD